MKNFLAGLKNFLDGLFVLLLFVTCFILGIAIIWWIACSDLPFWVKLWLLK